MVVAVYGGGAYNVLPVDGEGRIGRVSQAIKEIGRGVDWKLQAAAHPHSVVFHNSGKFVVGTDLGCDRINVFAFEDGRLRRIQRIATPPGSGPGKVWLVGDGLEMLVEHRLGRSCGSYRLRGGGRT
jgi:6-phosphogluconolactonase (cycloisomerase 2 family)